ncbi:ABC transporter ATP-binding protein [Neoroseomonas lacus]|uniref:ABC transporter ATP-binding protein n=1 Tax=Neoroseomonas lacus TaxID=287609 RepID=A0A917KM29_9PROT|nr:ABC transporter ATP-binding protein [Neoroseomonas lacus]GGJ18418.1 ABC transporter ATP-binding protein [Neoroseomonas lacus]
MSALLELDAIEAGYGKSRVLHGVTLSVAAGETVALLGRNGAGKTTTMRCIMGLLPPTAGRIAFDGRDLRGMPSHAVARLGLSLVPEHRGVFAALTVEENLRLAVRRGSAWTFDSAMTMFPALAARRRTPGGKLSGGEQQMLAIARALMPGPRLLLLDEPTEGLAPVIVERLVVLLKELKAHGLPMLLVEQSLEVCRAVADRHVMIDEGHIVWAGDTAALGAATDVVRRHLTLEDA